MQCSCYVMDSRPKKYKVDTCFVIAITLLSNWLCLVLGSKQNPNIWFIAVDDLRPELGVYMDQGAPWLNPNIYTPNIDRLASRSFVSTKSFVQQALCSPSRASAMTGRRPETTRVFNLDDYWRDVGGDFHTIPQYFKDNGYTTYGYGKIYHPGSSSGGNDPPSWTDHWRPPNNVYWSTNELSVRPVPLEDRLEMPLPDEQLTEKAIEALEEFAESGKPFYLATGFFKPHLPFTFPDEYLDLYPEDEIELPANPYAPWNMPNMAWTSYSELRSYEDIEALGITGAANETGIPDETILSLRRGYYACVSYIDNQIGQVMDKLEELDLAEDTIIVFWSDHGFQLGEHGSWCKHSNFELSTNAPLMISVPKLTDEGYVDREHLTESVDMFPTLVELAGLPPIELCPENSTLIPVCTEGMSLVPLMEDPESPWKERVYTQHQRWSTQYMGFSVRTHEYRYTEWVGFPDRVPDWEDMRGIELYDLVNDPREMYNRVDDPNFSEVQAELRQYLRAGWRSALL